jgi:large subunit ribosomal protein L20
MNGVLRDMGFRYSAFINELKKKNIGVNRKVLSQLAFEDKASFKKLITEVMS